MNLSDIDDSNYDSSELPAPRYLGEEIVPQKETIEFQNFQPTDWAMHFIEKYGSIDESHHKSWVLDQVMRILKGTTVTISVAKWDDGTREYRVCTEEPSQAYLDWRESMKGNIDPDSGKNEYIYDVGIAP